MSPEQQRKKAMARDEAINHAHYANVMDPRGGMDHEDHKTLDLAKLDKQSVLEESMEHGKKLRGM